MIISCPNCNAQYNLNGKSFGDKERSVRCTKCSHVWKQGPVEETNKAGNKETKKITEEKKSSFFSRKSGSFIGGSVLGILIFSLLVFSFFAKHTVMSIWPSTKNIYTSIGLYTPIESRLKIEDLKPSQEIAEDGQYYVIVEGFVVNLTDEKQEIPSLKCTLYDKDSNEIKSWSFSPEIHFVEPGSRIPFLSKLKNPPSTSKRVGVTFDADKHK